jgi:thiol-disulfide isomerase/thioredoxin
MDMISGKSIFPAFFVTLIAVFLFSGVLSLMAQEAPFPSYGSGAVEVRLYTDYFCPPCRSMEQAIEPVLKNLLKKKLIRLTFVDVPFNPKSPLYAKYFLYSLAKNNDVEHAIHVRNILFEAAARNDVNTKEQTEKLLTSKGIAYVVWNTKPAFDRFNALIKADKIDRTPTCVIVKGGKKLKYLGKPDILNALTGLK